ncbi:MAG: hypothetical protein V4671_07555, partial [Armatimonadota bacterium]
KKTFLPLSDTDRLRRLNNGISISKAALVSGLDTAESSTTLSAVPPPQTPPLAIPTPATADTLQSVAERVAQKETKTVLVKEELREKPAILIGGEHAAADTEFRALSAVYGLRLLAAQGGSHQAISRYPVGRPSSISRLHEAILSAIPAPFMRALLSGTPDAPAYSAALAKFEEEYRATAAANGFTPPTRQSNIPPPAPEKVFEKRLREIRNAAAQKLRARLVTRVAASRTGRVSLSELSPGERTALADVLMVDHLSALGSVLTSPVPESIAKFEQSSINCRRIVSNGIPCISVAFYQPRANSPQYFGGMSMTVVDRSETPVPPGPSGR